MSTKPNSLTLNFHPDIPKVESVEKSIHSNLDKARMLRKAKFLPSDYNLKTGLTESQKRHVRRLWNQYKEIAEAPEEFIIKKAPSRKAVLKAKQTGFAAHNDRIYIHRDKNLIVRSIKITDDEIVRRYVEPTARGDNIKVIETPLIYRRDIFREIEWLKENRPLGRYDSLSVRIGAARSFSQHSRSYDGLEKYVSNWYPKDYDKYNKEKKGYGDQIRMELIERMEIVTKYVRHRK